MVVFDSFASSVHQRARYARIRYWYGDPLLGGLVMPAIPHPIAPAILGGLGDLFNTNTATIEPPQPIALVRIKACDHFGSDCSHDLLEVVRLVDIVQYAAAEECPVPELRSLWGRGGLPFEYA